MFLFYLLASYVSTSRGKGHTETRGKDTELRNTVRVHRVRLLLRIIKSIEFNYQREITDRKKTSIYYSNDSSSNREMKYKLHITH